MYSYLFFKILCLNVQNYQFLAYFESKNFSIFKFQYFRNDNVYFGLSEKNVVFETVCNSSTGPLRRLVIVGLQKLLLFLARKSLVRLPFILREINDLKVDSFVQCYIYLLGVHGGYITFTVSIITIGMITAVIGDVASHLGCFIFLKDTVNAIAFVALGTSVPGIYDTS